MGAAATVSAWISENYARNVFRATVTGSNGNQVLIQRIGQAAADSVSYPRLSTYTPVTIGDEVLLVSVAGGAIVVGKIVR